MSDLSLPLDYPVVPAAVAEEIKLVKLAREIAIDILPLDDILKNHNIQPIEFDAIKHSPHFTSILKAEVEAWSNATNTPERVRLKAASMVEEYLPELYSRLNDRDEKLADKIKGLEVVSRLAEIGNSNKNNPGDISDRVTITINLGNASKLEYNKPLPPKVIDHEPAEDN